MSTINWQAQYGGVHRATIGWVEIEVVWQGKLGGWRLHCNAPPIRCALKSADLDEAKQEALGKVLRELRAAVKVMEDAGASHG